MLEELKKFWNENVEGPVKSVGVQQFGRIFADLLQCSKRTLDSTSAADVRSLSVSHIDASRNTLPYHFPQGSAATRLRCGGIITWALLKISLACFPKVILSKSVNISQN